MLFWKPSIVETPHHECWWWGHYNIGKSCFDYCLGNRVTMVMRKTCLHDTFIIIIFFYVRLSLFLFYFWPHVSPIIQLYTKTNPSWHRPDGFLSGCQKYVIKKIFTHGNMIQMNYIYIYTYIHGFQIYMDFKYEYNYNSFIILYIIYIWGF